MNIKHIKSKIDVSLKEITSNLLLIIIANNLHKINKNNPNLL